MAMAKRDKHSRRSSPGERVAGAVLLAALPAVALAIVLAPGAAGPGTPGEPAGEEGLAEEVVMQPQFLAGRPAGASSQPSSADLTALLPRPDAESPFRVAAPPKHWPAEKMYEKINGEDTVYLDAGCVGLAAMTVTNASGTETIDLYLFGMKTPAAAEEVFAQQAPDDSASDPAGRPAYVDLGDKAYTIYGSCFVRAGPLYLKIMVNAESDAAIAEAMKLAVRFTAARAEPN